VRSLALCLALAACGSPRTEPTAPAPAPVNLANDAGPPDAPDWSPDAAPTSHVVWPDRIDDDRQALSLWRQLGPTGADAYDRAFLIPEPHQKAMARAILRDGHFDCPTQVSVGMGGCVPDWLEFVPPAATAGFDDPCVRRMLADWASVPLESADFVAMRETSIALVSLPYPEEMRVRDVIGNVEDEPFELELLAIVKQQGFAKEFVVDGIAQYLGPASLVVAAAALHIDNAVERVFLDEGYSGEDRQRIGLAALADDPLRTDTREFVAGALSERYGQLDKSDRDRKAIAKALEAATTDPSCAVAGAARGALARIRDKPATFKLPKRRTPGTFARLACEAYASGAATHAVVRMMTGGKPLVVRDRVWDSEPNPYVADDGDGDPLTFSTTTTIDVTQPFDSPISWHNERLLESCDPDGLCVSASQKEYLRFHLSKGSPSKRRLVELETYALWSGCTPPPPLD
jgi:hypothetical protein